MTSIENSTAATDEQPALIYGDMSLTTASGARNRVYVIPAEENGGTPEVFVWGCIGSGEPERAYHDRWFCVGHVESSAVPESIERVLRDHEDELLAIAARYQGATWNGSNHVGKWEDPGLDDAEVMALSSALNEGVTTYWKASDWFAPVTLHEIVRSDGLTLDQIVAAEVDQADPDATLDPGDVRDWLEGSAKKWLERHADADDDDADDAKLRARLVAMLAAEAV